MVINDKALVREMKRAYKGGGYNVIIRPGGRTVINCFSWAVEIENENLPREVLSVLALHMGCLPEEGETYKIMKGAKEPTVQKMIFDTAMEPVRRLEQAVADATEAVPVAVKKTMLTFDGWNVWQKTGNNGILLVDPAYEMMLRKLEDVIAAGDAIYKEGAISKAYIMRGKAEMYENQLNYLGQIPWAAK